METVRMLVLAFLAFIGLPAFYIGWWRPRPLPWICGRILFASIALFAAAAISTPLARRDILTLGGSVLVSGVTAFFGFVFLVWFAERLRRKFPYSENFPGLAALARKY